MSTFCSFVWPPKLGLINFKFPAKSTMHNSVLNPMLIPPVNFVGLELTANVAQSMELSSSYFETAEFCDLSVVVELGEL
mgnify:CR=1 FL=1